MWRIYYRQVRKGKRTIEQVPEQWRALVQAALDGEDEGHVFEILKEE